MSYGLRLGKFQGVLVLALMLIFFVAVSYSDISLFYKVIISLLVFSLIFLVSVLDHIFWKEHSSR